MRKLLLAAVALVLVAPFLYMLSVSFMGEAELLRWPPPLLPRAPTTANYTAMVEALPYWRVLANSSILAVCVIVAHVLTSAPDGYGVARLALQISWLVRSIYLDLSSHPVIHCFYS